MGFPKTSLGRCFLTYVYGLLSLFQDFLKTCLKYVFATISKDNFFIPNFATKMVVTTNSSRETAGLTVLVEAEIIKNGNNIFDTL